MVLPIILDNGLARWAAGDEKTMVDLLRQKTEETEICGTTKPTETAIGTLVGGKGVIKRKLLSRVRVMVGKWEGPSDEKEEEEEDEEEEVVVAG